MTDLDRSIGGIDTLCGPLARPLKFSLWIMPPYEERFAARDGLQLYYRRWLPSDEPAAVVVVVVHGIGEHGGRYAGLAEEVCRHDYATYALDLRGHGNSDGDRVLVAAFADYVNDLESLLDRLATVHPHIPLYLLGHSMGGAIVAHLALRGRPEIRGLILSAAALRIAGNLFPLLRKLAGLFSRLTPRLRLVRLGSGRLSRDPASDRGLPQRSAGLSRQVSRPHRTPRFSRPPRQSRSGCNGSICRC